MRIRVRGLVCRCRESRKVLIPTMSESERGKRFDIQGERCSLTAQRSDAESGGIVAFFLIQSSDC